MRKILLIKDKLKLIKGKFKKLFLAYKILNKINRNKVLLVGTPEHCNIGDSAIVLAQKKFLNDCGIKSEDVFELTVDEYNLVEPLLNPNWLSKKLIIGLGGGNFGDLWPNEEELRERFINKFKKNNIIIFPQTVMYQDNSNVVSAVQTIQKCSTIALYGREQKSFELLKSICRGLRADVSICPDIVMYINKSQDSMQREDKVMICMRNDKEKAFSDEGLCKLKESLVDRGQQYYVSDMIVEGKITKSNRKKKVIDKLNEFSRAKFVITDRLHGMIFSTITGTPCIVFGNNHHKVGGSYEWISYLPYVKYCNTVDDAINLIPDMSDMGPCKYDNTPLLPYYDELKARIKKYAIG